MTMSGPDLIVGLDCGTSVIKAAAFDEAGGEVAVSQASMEGLSTKPGHIEYRPEDLWQAAAQALRGLVTDKGVAPERIAAIGPTGAGNGLLMLDQDDRPVRDGIFALDTRAADMIADEADTGLPARTRAINGQGNWTGQTVYLLKWTQRYEPDAIKRARKILTIKDYVKFRLTKQYIGDASEQSKVGLLDIFQCACTRELLELYRIDELLDCMPPIKPSVEVIGEVTEAAAQTTGLRAGTPVVNGLADIDASALGAGVTRAGQLSIVAGTWSINQFFVDQPVIDERLFGLSHYAVEGVYEHLEASPSSTANLSWFIKHGCADLEQDAQRRGVSVYEKINELVASKPAAANEVFFHPYLYGSNTQMNARAGFYGLAGWQDRADLLAALFEGVVFSHHTHVEKLCAVGGDATEVHLSGGAAHSEIWSQMFCDVIGLPVLLPRASEVGALGAAMCAAVGAGMAPHLTKAAEKMVAMARRHQPNQALHQRYAQRFEAYKNITRMMGPIWDELARVFSAT